MHYLIKSSQKAPKGSKYYYSHFIGKDTGTQNFHISFRRSTASGKKNQDSNPHLRAKSIILNSYYVCLGGKAERALYGSGLGE